MQNQLSTLSMKKTRRDAHLHEQELYSRLEIQERTLHTYTKEIYENIGQVLSLAKLQLFSLQIDEKKVSEKILDSGKLVGKAIADLRNLTHQLSPEEIIRKGFAYAVCYELKRLNEAGLCNAVFSVTGNYFSLGDVKELVTFNVLQKLIYPVLNINSPGIIRVVFRYNVKTVNIDFEREIDGQPHLIENKGMIQFKERLKYIDSNIRYRNRDKQNLQITINK